jgi:Cu+-exporting ATPase
MQITAGATDCRLLPSRDLGELQNGPLRQSSPREAAVGRPARVDPARPPDGAAYVCPMHPQIRQAGPGVCPICGMSLEPERVAAEPLANAELGDFIGRLWVGIALTAPVFVLEMGRHLLGHRMMIPDQTSAWIQFALATPVVLWAGWPFLVRGWRSLETRTLNMFTLIAMGVGVTWTYSVVALLWPQVFPVAARMADGSAPIYFEPAAVITVLVLLGQVLELHARARTSGSIRALLNLAPKTAWRLEKAGAEAEIPLGDVQVGDRLRVRPGDKVPVDGTILEGRVSIDESLVTGESTPVTKIGGDTVIGGAINTMGAFQMRADKVGSDTVLAQIVDLTARARRSRAPIQELADRVSGAFVPAVVAVAILTFGAWSLWGPEPRLSYALMAAVSVLIVACPCALGLATPISIMVGLGRGAQSGILIKDAEALERFERVDTLVVDKTGTLTEGRPAVTGILSAAGVEEAELLRLVASLERSSEHPLARAIGRLAEQRELTLSEPTDFNSPVGRGVTGRVDGRRLVVGSSRFLMDEGIATAALEAAADTLRKDGNTAIFAAVDGKLASVLAISDPIKVSALDAIRALKADGLRLVMTTGDNRTTALAVAAKLGIEEVEAEDGLVFTAGIGENAPRIRADVAERLAWAGLLLDASANASNHGLISPPTSRLKAWVISTDEEAMVARHMIDRVRLGSRP